MERKVWRRPLTKVQKFEANEYVAACAYGVCNINGYVFEDNNGNGVIDSGDDYIYSNDACRSPFIVQGVDSPTPENNVLVFGSDQVEWGYRWVGIIRIPYVKGVKESEKNNGVGAFHWDDHVTTQWNTNPERPNHS